MRYIDFREVRGMFSLEEVLSLVLIRKVKRRGDKGRCRCPHRCSESDLNCSLRFDRKLWHCHRCGRGGNHLDLFCEYYALSLANGAIRLCELLGRPVPYFERGGCPEIYSRRKRV